MDQVTSLKTNNRGYFRSSSFMMALLFTVMLGMASGILGYSGYYLNRNHFILGIEEILDTEFSYLNSALNHGQFEKVIKERFENSNRIYLVEQPDKGIVSGNITAYPKDTKNLKDGLIYFTRNHSSDFYAAKAYKMSNGYQIFIGSNMSDLVYTERVILGMGAITILLMMLVIIVSYLISTFVVSRTNRIAETAHSIMQTGDLSQRIIIDSRWDDLSNMAFVLNNLLARIEELMIGIKRVTDNIAHDLRTPLTRLRNNLETIGQGKDIDQISNLIGEADRLLLTFQSLLRISKIENAASKEYFVNCDLNNIISDVIELYQPLAIEKEIALHSEILKPAPYHGDVNLLFQMYANLLDNAIKFTPPSGVISITLNKNTKAQFISVFKDSGGGISEVDKKYVFDRFYRGEKSRSTEGNGLGLSLVQAVVNLHDGKISLENCENGLRVELTL